MKAAHQIVTALSYGDAIGDYTVEIQRILRGNGYCSEIYSEIVHPRMARHVRQLEEYEADADDRTLMILHFSIGSYLGYVVPRFPGRKMMIYHNITPYEWFVDINSVLAKQCLIGRKQLQVLRDCCPIALGDSEYNRQELESAGYAVTGVLPIRLALDRFDGKPDPLTLRSYDDERTNIIVVGRVIPNKKLEDCLKLFAVYQKQINPLSRLIFAGMWNGFEKYYFGLRALADRLGAQEVVFTGHIGFEELLACYRVADAFLTMSEHEGFCVPVVEAFYMRVPVLAWSAGAVPHTAGGGGLLFGGAKDYVEMARALHRLCTDQQLRNRVIEAQTLRLLEHQNYPFEASLLQWLQRLEEGSAAERKRP